MGFKLPALRQQPLSDQDRSVPINLLTYVTPGVLVTMVMALFACWSNWDMLTKAFGSGAVLNGSIIAIGLIGVMRSVWSNLRCWITARFLKAIDDVKTRETPLTEAETESFRRALKNDGRLLDIKQMADLLENLPTLGHLNITDNDARMIKSKLGFRVSLMRANTGFLAGILVMLGLLGTFLGLLQTIDSVGAAMGSMSNIGGADPEAMSGFLTAIAAPLTGMGLAFSSSLFGLAGSLLVSFTNYLCSGVHDRFIERVSRWVDDRIPSPTQEARKAQGNPKVAGSDELKAWLAGFAQSALVTNRNIERLVGVISDHMATVQASASAQHEVLAETQSAHRELKELRRAFARGLHVVRKEINDRGIDITRKLGQGAEQIVPAVDLSQQSASRILRVGEDSAADSRAQLSALVSELQALLDGQDLMQAFRSRQTTIDSDGLPPTFRDDVETRPVDRRSE